MARVMVVGAGVVSVVSAYLLCKTGHQVTLVDHNAGPCGGASVRNGAQLSYAYGDALASPSFLAHIPSIMLGRAEATVIEPALDRHRDEIAGVIYSPEDAAGRPSEFCAQLSAHLQLLHGLTTRYQCEAERLLTHRGRARDVMFRNFEMAECDAVVIATSYGTRLSRLFSPAFSSVWRVQSYSVTLAATRGAMTASIIDLKRKLVFARLGDQIRIAGLADIGPRRFVFSRDRFQVLKDSARAAFAQGFEGVDGADTQAWSDARPCTPFSRPIIGPGKVRGGFLDYDHGTLGWTLCLGSGARLHNLMEENGF